MSTYKRGRSDKLEINLTSSFIAGGTQYTHHDGSLVASYRFEEPFVVDIDNPDSLKVKDVRGDVELEAVITSGSFSPAEEVDESIVFLPSRTAASTPHAFSRNSMPASNYTDEEKLTTPNETSGFQIRSLNFGQGMSERVELPEAISTSLNDIERESVSQEKDAFSSGASFAFWIKIDGNDALFETVSEGYNVKNPYTARSVFSADRENYFVSDGPLLGDEIDFGRAFSIRVINDPTSSKHRKVSVISTYTLLGEKSQFEWLSKDSLSENVWTHICVVFPFTKKADVIIIDPDVQDYNIAPRVYFDGRNVGVNLQFTDVKNTIDLRVIDASLDSPDFINVYIDTPYKSGIKTSLLRLAKDDTEIFPSASIKVDTDFLTDINHMSTFTIKNDRGEPANFLFDFFHTGSIARYLNENVELESPQMVNAQSLNLATIEIAYDPDSSSFDSAINPANLSYCRITTPNNLTRTYMFDNSLTGSEAIETITPTSWPLTGIRVATAKSLPSNTYLNGVDGVGATITATDDSALSVDDILVSSGNLILVKDEPDGYKNGIYGVTSAGSAGSTWSLIRHPDANSSGSFERGKLTPSISAGSVNQGKKFIHMTQLNVVLGTTPLQFVEAYTGATSYAYTTIKPVVSGGLNPWAQDVSFCIYHKEHDNSYVRFQNAPFAASPVQGPDGQWTYYIDTTGVASLGQYANAILATLFNAAIDDEILDLTVAGLNASNSSPGAQIVAGLVAAGTYTIPLRLNYSGAPARPHPANIPDTRSMTISDESVVERTVITAPAIGVDHVVDFDFSGVPTNGTSFSFINYNSRIETITFVAGSAGPNEISIDTLDAAGAILALEEAINNFTMSGFSATSAANLLTVTCSASFLTARPGDIFFEDGADFFDVAFNGSFGMGNKSNNISAVFNTGSLSFGFDHSQNVFFESLLTPATFYNYSGFPFYDKLRNTINTVCNYKGDLSGTPSPVELVRSGYPVFIFGDGSSQTDTAGAFNSTSVVEGKDFASNRYIRTTQKLKGDAVVRFSCIPAKSQSDFSDKISKKLINPPEGDDKGLCVQVSYDGVTWFGAKRLVSEIRYDNNISYARVNDADQSKLNLVKCTTSTTDANREKIIYDDFTGIDDSDFVWQTHAFYCDSRKIVDDETYFDYYVRIIQEGYDSSYSDNWAIANITIEGTFSHDIRRETPDTITLVKIGDTAEDTWDNFVTGVNEAHLGEITAIRSSQEKTIKLQFNSPIGIIDEGVSGGQILSSSYRTRQKSLDNNAGFAAAFAKQERVKLINFDGGGTSKAHNDHIRIGLKDISDLSSAVYKISTVINSSSMTYALNKSLTSTSKNTYVDIFSEPSVSATTKSHLSNILTVSGEIAANITASDFTDFRFAKSIDISSIPAGPDYNSLVAANIRDTINEYSSSFGVKAWGIGTATDLTEFVTLEHLENNADADNCEVNVFFADNGNDIVETTDQILTNPIEEDLDEPGPNLFSGGMYSKSEPQGDVLDFGKCFLGTSPNDLEYYMASSYPIRGYQNNVLPTDPSTDSEFASKLAGRTPKCLIDDFSIWSRCLLSTEVAAIVAASRGAYEPITGLSSHDPRIQIREQDNFSGIYPTNSRITDEDFTGRFSVFYDSKFEINDETGSSEVEYPYRISNDHPLISYLTTSGHARSTLDVESPMKQFNKINLETLGEIITPYREEGQFAAFGVAIHDDADTNFTNSEKFGIRGGFWSSGSSTQSTGDGRTGPVWAKHKIEIDLKPTQSTKLYKHTTLGSTTAYFNFESNVWEPIGTISSGSYLTDSSAHEDSYAKVRILFSNIEITGSIPNGGAATTWYSSMAVDRREIFHLQDAYGKRVKFCLITDEELEIESTSFRRYGSGLYGILVDSFGFTAPDFCQRIYLALNAAFLIGDLNIKPVYTASNRYVDLIQADFGSEGNTEIYFNSDFVPNNAGAPSKTVSDFVSFFIPETENFNSGTHTLVFVGGDREQIDTASTHGKQSLYTLDASGDSQDNNFRKWMDTLTVGFGPSIGMLAVKSDASDLTILKGDHTLAGKYVFRDSGLATPVTTFGFPFHPKFHATSSQTFNVTDVIDRPFVVEKIVYQFRADLFESASIQCASYGSTSSFTDPAFINMPTPTFFILNQRKCVLPNAIENDINLLSLFDANAEANTSFNYSATIPSSFYLTSMSSDSGNVTHVDTLRDLVTFARFSSVPGAFNSSDFENFVPDARENIDLVIVPSDSAEANDDKQLLQSNEPAASFTIAAPVRAPRRNTSAAAFKTEGDFFGSDKSVYTFEVNEIESPIKPYSDGIILEDSAGTIRRFIFSNGSAAKFEMPGAAPGLVNKADLLAGPECFVLIDSAGKVVTFTFKNDLICNEPVKNDATEYFVGIKDLPLSSSDPSYIQKLYETIAASVNLAYLNEDLDIFAVVDAVVDILTSVTTYFITFYQGTVGNDGNTEIQWLADTYNFTGGSSPTESSIVYKSFGNSFDLGYESVWIIPVFKNASSPGGAEYYASRFYDALSIANETLPERGGFACPFELQLTGSSPTSNFTFSQCIGGRRGYKNIAGTQGVESFKDLYFASLFTTWYTDYASIECTTGSIQADTLKLGWAGNRTGIDVLLSGRSPFGGENSSADFVYTLKDGTQTCTINHVDSDSIESPYLLMPGDKLVFGWQSPIATGSHLQHLPLEAVTPDSGSFEILPGAGKITIYGAVLQGGDEKNRVTSNQPLTSEALHESIFGDADVFDIFDTDPYVFHADNYLDQHVDGEISLSSNPPVYTRRVISKATDGNHAVGPKNGTYPIFSKRASFFRGRRLVDESEVFYDSMLPNVSELMSRDSVVPLSPASGSEFDSVARTGVVILSHPYLESSEDDNDLSNSAWKLWMSSFPFESRYEGITRTQGFDTGIIGNASFGSIDAGRQRITHVWLANSSKFLKGYHDDDADQSYYANMLYNIEAPRLYTQSTSLTIGGKAQPYNLNFSIITNEEGEGSPGEELTNIDFDSKLFGTKIGPRSRSFFSKIFFGSGEGTCKFPKLSYWKNIVPASNQGFGTNDTFPATRGAVIRGFKYGLSNIEPTKTSAIFRRDRFGHFRDILEQRLFVVSNKNRDASLDEIPVTVQFRKRDGQIQLDPTEANGSNLSLYCTSSVPYDDGNYRDRATPGPDDRDDILVVL